MTNKNGLVILPGGNNQEPDRMQIADTAEQQFIHYYNNRGIRIDVIKEGIRKWNAGLDPQSLVEATMFEWFREIQRKAYGI